MKKSICLLSRKEGTARAAFRDYYENNHAPLALGLFPFKKYIRNHLLPDGDLDLDFDTISEFWLDSYEPVFALMEGDVGKTMKADEVKFMNQKLIRSGASDEYLLRGGRRIVDNGLRKTALMLKRDAALSAAAFAEVLKTWGKALPAERVSLDLVEPWADGWPCDAVLWIWGEAVATPPLPSGVQIFRKLITAAHETSPDTCP